MKHVIDPNSAHRDGTIYGDYDCTLNQTDLSVNANKFYIMQVIQYKKNNGSMTNDGCTLLIRYGRVGERGRLDESEMSPNEAADKFVKQFKAKTGNNWADRANFVSKKGKYTLCEMDYSNVTTSNLPPTNITGTNSNNVAPVVIPEAVCCLKPRVQEFLRLIGDIKEMQNAMVELELDANKLPLGKISQNQINRGYAILNQIILQLKNSGTGDVRMILMDLSSQYYTLIPHAWGRGSSPPLIDTPERISKYIEILDELSNLQVAATVVQPGNDTRNLLAANLLNADGSRIHPLDTIYKEINAKIRGVKKNSAVWNTIQQYITNTHGSTHNNYAVDLLEIYKVGRQGESDNYQKCLAKITSNNGNEVVVNRQLLWHGTRLTNYISILKNGLLLRPDVIPGTYITGKMFGYGIYAANSFSKSFNYTGADKKNPVACLLLGEFALGNCLKKVSADSGLTGDIVNKQGCHSTWGQGQYTPSSYSMMKDGVLVPTGKLEKSNISGANLLYDEFIVYDQNQFNIKYVVLVKARW